MPSSSSAAAGARLPSNIRGSAKPSYQSAGRRCCTSSRIRPGALALGMRTTRLPCFTPDSWLTTACQRGSSSGASLVLSSTRRARGSAMRSTNCSKIAATAPERLDAGHVLAGQHEVDALRAAAARDVLEQGLRRLGDGVALGEEVLELVDHGDDPRPLTLRVDVAQVLQLGDLVLLGFGGPAAHLVGEELQAAPSPNSRSSLTLSRSAARAAATRCRRRRGSAGRTRRSP